MSKSCRELSSSAYISLLLCFESVARCHDCGDHGKVFDWWGKDGEEELYEEGVAPLLVLLEFERLTTLYRERQCQRVRMDSVKRRAILRGLGGGVLWALVSNLSGCQRTISSRDVLRVALPGQPTTFDPNRAYDAISGTILSQLHEGLTRHDGELDTVPALAESWEFSRGYTTIIFTLREGIRWSDGKPIVASDFVYSWRRLLDPKTRAEYAYFLFDVVGAEAYHTGQGKKEDVGVRALDARRIEVSLIRPAPYFPHLASFMVTYPVRRDIIERHGDAWTRPEHVVVSGPFMPESYQQDYCMKLVRNPEYTLAKVPMRGVEFYQVAEKSTALNLFLAGSMDIVLDMLPLAIPGMKEDADYYNGPKLEVRYVGFRLDHPGVSDVRVRRALSMAIKREEFPEVLRGGELPTKSWLPPGMFGHDATTGEGYQPEKARELLAQAGFPEGEGFPKLRLLFRAGDDWRLMAENIQEQWRRELGVEVDVEVRDQKVFFQEIDGDAPPPMHLARWVADFPDPENFMGLFKSNSGNNSLKFLQPDYDELVDRAVKVPTKAERLALYSQAQRMLVEQHVAMAPLYVNAQNHLRRANLRGLEFNAMGDLFLGPVWREES